MWELIQLAKLTEKGLPPVAGGSLDQSHQFLEACTFLWSEQARIKNEIGAVGLEN